MSLNISTGVTPSQEAVDRQVQRAADKVTLLTPQEVAVELADAYFAYSKEGTLLGADLTVGGAVALLEAGFVTDNTPATIDRIAEGICNYWATNITPGAPAHGGTAVVSVVINGAAVLPAMKAAISGVSSGGLTELYQATEDVVKTIPCIITELMPPNNIPTPFPETIS